MLELIDLTKSVAGQPHIQNLSLTLKPGSVNCLLGPTHAGKTTLLRLIAGLDNLTSGRIMLNGEDLVSKRVQDRNVAMVYQDFVNYPSLTVYENIASPLRVAGHPRDMIDNRVRQMAELLGLSDKLSAKPQGLSGGQQQRTALARALIKQASVVLLDEPLANLDYKLREELREEIPKLVADLSSIVVFATSDPTEALMLGGTTATLFEGQVWQYGQSSKVYREPDNLRSARVFSHPPLNEAEVEIGERECTVEGVAVFERRPHMRQLPPGKYQFAVRPDQLSLTKTDGSLPVPVQVQLAEVTGSETIIHTSIGGLSWIALAAGTHPMSNNDALTLYLNPDQMMIFDSAGKTLTLGNAQAGGTPDGAH